jgi:S-DNA-T family DNA segregation ATPase FtsK/SpoIIIE
MATRAAEKRQTTGAKSNSRANEVIAVILAALTILIFLCLISYDPMDPTFNTASSQKVKNWVGVAGANFAELLISIIGITAHLLPALILLMAWRVFRARDLRLSLTQLLGYLLFVVSFSSLAALLGFQGGILGVFFEQIFLGLLGKIGTGILLSAFVAASLLLITNLSLASAFGDFGMAFENFGIHVSEWRKKRNAGRADRNKDAFERMEKRRETRDENPRDGRRAFRRFKKPAADRFGKSHRNAGGKPRYHRARGRL